MATNALTVINKVLQRLREDTITTTVGNPYARLLMTMVGDVDRELQDRWNWISMRRTETINTVIGTARYLIPNTVLHTNIRLAYNDTLNGAIRPVDYQWMTEKFQSTPVPQGNVYYYSVAGEDLATNQLSVDVYPIPNSVQVLRFNLQGKYAPPENDTDFIYVPEHLLVLGVLARAYAERGDSEAITARADVAYNAALATAIAIDMEKAPGETDWNPM